MSSHPHPVINKQKDFKLLQREMGVYRQICTNRETIKIILTKALKPVERKKEKVFVFFFWGGGLKKEKQKKIISFSIMLQ